MSDYLHWHKVGDLPSACVLPPKCCADAIETVWQRRVDDVEHAERRRVILSAVAAATTYGEAAASVLDPERAELVGTVMARVLEAIKRSGCICPFVDVSSFANPPGSPNATMRGYDGRCGMHGVGP